MRPHILIIGASAAGVTAAVELREAGFDGRVTLLDEGSEVPYERPPLSKAMIDGSSNEPTPILPADAYADLDIELRRGARAVEIDVSNQAVILATGERLRADQLLLTTGARPRRLQVPGAELSGVRYLRDVEDAAVLANRLRRPGPHVVIGAGLIGLEYAAVANSAGRSVTVVEATEHPLKRSLGGFAPRVIDLHRSQGVEILTAVGVASIEGLEGQVSALMLDDGRRIPCETIVVGIGVLANADLAASVGLATPTGITVDGCGRTAIPWIHAAGDVSCYPHPHRRGHGRFEHWEVARRHGAHVARSILGADEHFIEVPYFWTSHYGRTVQGYGLPSDSNVYVERVVSEEQALGFWVREDGTLSAAVGMDCPRDIRACRALIEERALVRPEELTDADISLRRLVKRPPRERTTVTDASVSVSNMTGENSAHPR